MRLHRAHYDVIVMMAGYPDQSHCNSFQTITSFHPIEDFIEIQIKMRQFSFQRIRLTNVACEMSAILSRSKRAQPHRYSLDTGISQTSHTVGPINLSPPWTKWQPDILRCICMNEKFFILIKISLKFDPIDNNPVLV